MENKIIQGDTLEVLKTLPDECVDSIITSPPYYGLRDYGVDGQIGLEKTLDEYLTKMLLITNELKRVLKKTGTMWWNHGDSYNGSGKGGTNPNRVHIQFGKAESLDKCGRPTYENNIPEKCQMLQNYRLALRMVDEQGWILRNQIIWYKPNCMPSSVKDRFTVDFEPVFFFSKSKKYWFEMQYEPHLSKNGGVKFNLRVRDVKRGYSSKSGQYKATYEEIKQYHGQQINYGKLGRNKRCVWKIPTHPFKDAHFATFPEKLIEPMIKAGCPEFICNKCGKARENMFDISYEKGNRTGHQGFHARGTPKGMVDMSGNPRMDKIVKKIGLSDCGCNAGFTSGIVLDPFMGSGTTAYVSRKLGRNYLGIELNEKYIEIANKRLSQEVLL